MTEKVKNKEKFSKPIQANARLTKAKITPFLRSCIIWQSTQSRSASQFLNWWKDGGKISVKNC